MPLNSSDVGEFLVSARRLTSAYRRKLVSPVEIVSALLAAIERHNPFVNAFHFVDMDGALKAARVSEQNWLRGRPRGVLEGVPVTIKDVLAVKGWRMTMGSASNRMAPPSLDDSPPVARLRESGAVFLGLTTTPEFGWKAVTDNPVDGITRNPWNTELTPGGSSGGAAAAAVLGLGLLHIGSDGGGSIRIPAGFSGVVGHKPSFGRVPMSPASLYGTVSHIGPITRSVEDAALMLTVLSRPDDRAWQALPFEDADYSAKLNPQIQGLRIGFSLNLGYCRVDEAVENAVRAAVESLMERGVKVDEVDPGFDDPIDIFHKHWFAGATHKLAGIDPSLYSEMDAGFLEIAQEGKNLSLSGYLEAIQRRCELGAQMNSFHSRYDILITPTLPITAFAAGQEVPDATRQKRWTEWAPFSYPFNLTQQPACSVPCGLSEAGLPVGLQIVGAMHHDQTVLNVAKAVEDSMISPLDLPTAPIIPRNRSKVAQRQSCGQGGYAEH